MRHVRRNSREGQNIVNTPLANKGLTDSISPSGYTLSLELKKSPREAGILP
jgi:hypothetical protein